MDSPSITTPLTGALLGLYVHAFAHGVRRIHDDLGVGRQAVENLDFITEIVADPHVSEVHLAVRPDCGDPRALLSVHESIARNQQRGYRT